MRKRSPTSGFSLLVLVFTLALFLSACFTRKTPAPFTPPPPQAAPVDAAPEHLPEPPLTSSIPDLSDATIGAGIIPNSVPEAPAPPAPKPPSRRPNPTPAPKQVVTPPVELPPAQQPPRLGQILAPDQIRDYNRAIDESLDRVRRVISNVGKKNLTADQAEILNRIQVFQKQAEEKREQDLVIAVSLAKRADLLAKDLQDRVQ